MTTLTTVDRTQVIPYNLGTEGLSTGICTTVGTRASSGQFWLLEVPIIPAAVHLGHLGPIPVFT